MYLPLNYVVVQPNSNILIVIDMATYFFHQEITYQGMLTQYFTDPRLVFVGRTVDEIIKLSGREVSESFYLPFVRVRESLSQKVLMGLGDQPEQYVIVNQAGLVEMGQR